MTKAEILLNLQRVQQAYQDSLDGKSVSFTGVNSRSVTNHDPAALRAELEYWEARWRAVCRRGSSCKLANFNNCL